MSRRRSRRVCSVDEMGNAIYKEFNEYVEKTAQEVKTICKEVAEETCEVIKENAPVDTGAYRKSWSIMESARSALGVIYTVYAKHYQLTHLLENGHAKRGGGRTRSFPHISKGEQFAIKELKKRARS